jgi:aminoglycoside 3-N-acetyltransferase I
MDQVRVKRLTSKDLAQIRALNALFGRCFEDPESYEAHRPTDAYLAELLGKQHVVVLVAESDSGLCGGLVAYELEKFEQARSEIYIYDLAVEEHARRRGVATTLIAAVSEIALERGAWVSFVQADYEDAPAVALYEKLGLREEVLHFDIPPKGKTAGRDV